MTEHKIIKREKEYLQHNSYGYSAECSCGKKFTGWSPFEVEEKILDHKIEMEKQK
jgi:hypothetical protein